MTKTTTEMKELVEEFIKVTGINYEDQTPHLKDKNEIIEWQYRVGTNVIINKNAKRNDRIHLSVNMRFTPQDADLLKIENPSFTKAIREISEICTICKVGHQWVKDNNKTIGLGIFTHVDEQILDRVNFHNAWDNLVQVTGHIQLILRSNFAKISHTAANKSIYG